MVAFMVFGAMFALSLWVLASTVLPAAPRIIAILAGDRAGSGSGQGHAVVTRMATPGRVVTIRPAARPTLMPVARHPAHLGPARLRAAA